MRSLIALHALMRAIDSGLEQTTLCEYLHVLEYWEQVRGEGD